MPYPSPQTQVLQELESSGWDPKDPSSYTSSGLAKLPYLEQCVKEVLRLYPPAAEVGKVAVDDMVLSGYQVAANTYLVSTYIGRAETGGLLFVIHSITSSPPPPTTSWWTSMEFISIVKSGVMMSCHSDQNDSTAWPSNLAIHMPGYLLV